MTTREDELVERLFVATAHGDQEHREWLHAAYTAFFAGQPVPVPRGSGRKEKLIHEQAAKITALSSERDLLVELLMEARSTIPAIPENGELLGHELELLKRIDAALTGVTGG